MFLSPQFLGGDILPEIGGGLAKSLLVWVTPTAVVFDVAGPPRKRSILPFEMGGCGQLEVPGMDSDQFATVEGDSRGDTKEGTNAKEWKQKSRFRLGLVYEQKKHRTFFCWFSLGEDWPHNESFILPDSVTHLNPL